MEASLFTFACPLPTSGGNSGNQVSTSPTAPPMFTSFSVRPSKDMGTRAAVQARYRARNQETERFKARYCMQARRVDEKEKESECLRRRVSSERLRASDVFQYYKLHLQRHLTKLCGQHSDPEYLSLWDEYRFSDVPFQFQEEDALFLLKYDGPIPRETVPSPDEVQKRLMQLKNCAVCLVFDWENEVEVKAYENLLRCGELEDDDVEFIFHHAEPTPTMETLARCICDTI
ncbi:hypothetical protein C8R45DRAFT_1089399 [Mycena sanguinolenta]|nr:hypothetical protein C8R45DRAFT_1089399 [Mycena sanguinolenta]